MLAALRHTRARNQGFKLRDGVPTAELMIFLFICFSYKDVEVRRSWIIVEMS